MLNLRMGCPETTQRPEEFHTFNGAGFGKLFSVWPVAAPQNNAHPAGSLQATHHLHARSGSTAMTQTSDLNPYERKILRALQADGRMSNAELAKQVGLSTTACWNYTRRLFDNGVIKSVHALIDPNAVEQGTVVLIGVVLDRSTPDSFAAFEAAARALPHVLECWLVAGDVDYFMKLRVRDLPAFNQLHNAQIIALPGVRQVRTFFVLNEVKSDGLLDF
jgi:Lrp/AsnC family leucine-responsive transcriptional regulator